MGKNIYQKWTPLEDLPELLYCEGLHDDYEGFRILLRGEDVSSSMLRLVFDMPLAYRNLDEGSLLRTLSRVDFKGKWSLFTVKSSTWLEWFHEESNNLYSHDAVIHYAIFTPNDCIDVLTITEPVIEWLR